MTITEELRDVAKRMLKAAKRLADEVPDREAVFHSIELAGAARVVKQWAKKLEK